MPVERRAVSVVKKEQSGTKLVQKVVSGSVSVASKSKLGRNGVGIYLLDEVNKGWRVVFLPLRKTTWVKRCPSDDDTCDLDKEKVKTCSSLTDTQKEKLTYFFAHVFDMDRDDIIALQDFEGFTEGGSYMCSGRLKFALKSLNDLVVESSGLQDALDDIQITCQDSDDSESGQSAGAVLEWLNDLKPDRIGRLLQEELKLSGESNREAINSNLIENPVVRQIFEFEDTNKTSSMGCLAEKIGKPQDYCLLAHVFTANWPLKSLLLLFRLRHFAEWSSNCGEYLILQQVQQGLIETFIYPLKQDADSSEGDSQGPKELDRLFLGLEEWLVMWGDILGTKKNFYDLPLWLQFLPKVMFTAINKSGTGRITKEELGSFYSSVMGYPAQKLNDLLNEAYNAMTAGGDFKLTYDCYRLCFANFLFGRHPNGPGQYIFGAAQKAPPPLFPIDYSAMNSSQEDIEPYDGSLKSNRSSIIV